MRFLVGISILCSTAAFVWHQPSTFTSNKAFRLHNGIQGTTALSAVAAGESEAERLLRKAKELRAQAEAAEHQVHASLTKKRQDKNAATDQLVDQLFFANSGVLLADRLRQKRLSIDTLETIVDRLDEREVIAEGKEHVQAKIGQDQTNFERVVSRDEAELQRLDGLIDKLIETVKVLDKDFLEEKQRKGETYVTHTEDQHWGGGKQAERLTNRIHEVRREREEQFQERMKEFNEAQRIKKGQKFFEDNSS